MKIRIFFVVLALVLGFAPAVLAQSATGLVTMHFDLSRHPADQEVRLWLPYPVSSPEQDIQAVQLKGDFAESAVYADKVFRTPILHARWPAGAASRRLVFSFQATRQEVARRDFPAKEAAWDPADHREWLKPTALGPVDGEVNKLADSITQGKSTVRAKARAIYDWICENMYRDPKTTGCGKGDVCALLKTPGGKCTDIHSVFVALCRAAGVPAREIFGLRLGKEAVTDITSWQHCWAEFFLPGYGWVPVDPADVRKAMLVKNLPLDHPEIKKLRDYYWGGWDAERFELAVGRDLTLTPAQQGGPLNTFGYPYAEVGGKPLDFYDPVSFKYSFTAIKMEKEGHGLIDTEGLRKMLAAGVPLLVFDARNPEEYQEVHIKGAMSLPEPRFVEYTHLLPADKSATLVFYCNGVKCGKSKKAAAKALSMGYAKVLVYAEGMPVWEEKGLPIYAGPDYEKKVETSKLAPKELAALIRKADGSFTLVDVRDPEEFREGHIPGAVNIPVASLASRSGVLDKEKNIIVYCNSGGRSYNAYRKLQKLGYENIRQTIFADWQEAGLPVETP